VEVTTGVTRAGGVVGFTVGVTVGFAVGVTVGFTVGPAVGVTVGFAVGVTEGVTVGVTDGVGVTDEGDGTGVPVGGVVIGLRAARAAAASTRPYP
jgi:hypothetical protein